jgi:hypothetical protein
MCSISESASTNKYKRPALRFVLAGESNRSVKQRGAGRQQGNEVVGYFDQSSSVCAMQPRISSMGWMI